MTSFLGARKRVEEFADVVDALLASGATSAAARPSTTVEPLLDLVVALRSTPVPVARPDFAAALRERLLVEAATALSAGPAASQAPSRQRPRRTRSQGRIAVAATALVAVGGTTGVATAAHQALPGDALYPVKRALEGAELRLSTSDTGRGRNLLQQATHRLEEVDGLLPETAGSAQAATRLTETLGAFADQAVEGSTLMLDGYREDGDTATVVEVRTFAVRSMTTLTGLAQSAPPDLTGDLSLAASAMQQVDAAALEACPGCGEEAPLQVPPDFGAPAAGGDIDLLGNGLGPSGGGTPASVPSDGVSPDGGWSPGEGGSQADGGGGVAPGEQPQVPGGLPAEGATPTGGADPSEAPSEGPAPGGTDGPSPEPPPGGTDVPTENPSEAPSENPTDDPTDGEDGDDGDGGTDEPDDADEDDEDDDHEGANDRPADGGPDPTDDPTDDAGGSAGPGDEVTGGSDGGDGTSPT